VRNRSWVCVVWFVFLVTLAAAAQTFPKVELAGGYSYINFHPNVPQLTSQNLNGGGGAFVYNITDWLGVRADFMGYTFGSGWNRKLQELGYLGSTSGNLFTYQFGPQIKKHAGKLQPFGETLYGVAHSNGYAAVLRAKGDGTYQLKSGGSNNNAFAMEIGGGLDIVLSRTVQVRPVEVDYQLTRFGFKNFSANQNNFKYFAGINFTLGGR